MLETSREICRESKYDEIPEDCDCKRGSFVMWASTY